VRDRETGVTERVSVTTTGAQANGSSNSTAISADGRYVAFASAAGNLVPGDTNRVSDVFVRDRLRRTTERVSLTASGAQANGPSGWSEIGGYRAISDDGLIIAFGSGATNLVPGDTNGQSDIFVRDRKHGTTERVSVAAGGAPADGMSQFPAVSGDGRFVAFASWAGNLVPEGTREGPNVFVRDRQAGTTEFVPGSSHWSGTVAINGDGHFVAFSVWGREQYALLRDRPAAATEVIAIPPGAGQTPPETGEPSISDDGRFVAFVSLATGRAPGDATLSTDVYVRDRLTGKTRVVSVSPDGAPANGSSGEPSISGDGRLVAFVSLADNLVPGDTNGEADAFVWDWQSGTTRLVSVAADGGPANGFSASPAISGDGRLVAFASLAGNLVPGDTNHAEDVFVRNLETETTERVSVTAGGVQADGYSGAPTISGDGRVVAFVSGATNLLPGDTNGEPDIFVRDLQAGTTERMSVATSGAPANGYSTAPSISGDGQIVAFASLADNLAPGDTNRAEEVLVRNRKTGTTERVSVSASGAAPAGASTGASISADGRFVAFQSGADDLVPGDSNGEPDIFVRDLETSRTEIVSAGGAPANGWSGSPSISGDGRFVAFQSQATNLTPGDRNASMDVFVAERQ
jgi:Tol biopolymer transport system component